MLNTLTVVQLNWPRESTYTEPQIMNTAQMTQCNTSYNLQRLEIILQQPRFHP